MTLNPKNFLGTCAGFAAAMLAELEAPPPCPQGPTPCPAGSAYLEVFPSQSHPTRSRRTWSCPLRRGQSWKLHTHRHTISEVWANYGPPNLSNYCFIFFSVFRVILITALNYSWASKTDILL